MKDIRGSLHLGATSAGLALLTGANLMRLYEPSLATDVLPSVGNTLMFANLLPAAYRSRAMLWASAIGTSLAGVATEVGQKTGMMNGTYDINDVYAYLLGGAATLAVGYAGRLLEKQQETSLEEMV